MATESDNIVAATAARICADLADPQTINSARDARWKVPLWTALEEAGLARAWVPEKFGGAGASLADGFSILGIAGRYALPVPLAETLLAGWLLSRAGIATPDGATTVAPARPRDHVALNNDGTLHGRVSRIPFAEDAKHIVVVTDGDDATIVLVKAEDCHIADGQGLGGDAANNVTFDRVKPLDSSAAPDGLDAASLMLMGAIVRSVQIAGALQAILALSVRYANERVAFERPIGKFHAVQHSFARLAGETAAALAAAGSAADTIARSDEPSDTLMLEAASAKIRTGEAAAEGASIAHQVHGAIGFTKEHVLHRFTLRMLGWRDDFGSESYWAEKLGSMVAKRSSANFWPMLASR
jgi:acyl-CoA dehydrogenase